MGQILNCGIKDIYEIHTPTIKNTKLAKNRDTTFLQLYSSGKYISSKYAIPNIENTLIVDNIILRRT